MQSWLFQREAYVEPPVPPLGTAAEAERIIQGVDLEEQVILFHSSTADQDESIRTNWLQPQMGEWVEEVLNGATDDEALIEQIKSEAHGVVYFSKLPGWIISKVARKVNKNNDAVTEEDIRQWGQLSIVVVDKDADEIKRYLGVMGSQSYYPYTSNLRGKKEKFYEHEEYFGLEPGDYFTKEQTEPAITLVGDELINFLVKHYPQALKPGRWKEDEDDREAITEGDWGDEED